MTQNEIAALLSQQIYQTLTSESPNNTFGPDDRFEIIQTTSTTLTSGYYGAIIKDTDTDIVYLVSRGTTPTSTADLAAEGPTFH